MQAGQNLRCKYESQPDNCQDKVLFARQPVYVCAGAIEKPTLYFFLKIQIVCLPMMQRMDERGASVKKLRQSSQGNIKQGSCSSNLKEGWSNIFQHLT